MARNIWPLFLLEIVLQLIFLTFMSKNFLPSKNSNAAEIIEIVLKACKRNIFHLQCLKIANGFLTNSLQWYQR